MSENKKFHFAFERQKVSLRITNSKLICRNTLRVFVEQKYKL